MRELGRTSAFGAEGPDPNDYVRSLAGQAAAAGILTAGDQERLQTGLLELLAGQAAPAGAADSRGRRAGTAERTEGGGR